MSTDRPDSWRGSAYALSAYLIWGLLPVYWKGLQSLAAAEILAYRILGAALCLTLCLGSQAQYRREWQKLGDPLNRRRILLSAALIGGNWLLYIWAVNSGQVLQGSLGYYINPLVNVLLGTCILKEQLNRAQWAAVILAGLGVLYLGLSYGQAPWISLTLAFSFGSYGLLKKQTAVHPLTALWIEVSLLSVPMAAYLIARSGQVQQTWLFANTGEITLMLGAGVVTVLPLGLFGMATRYLPLSTMGFFQYIAPSCMLLLAVWRYQEPFSSAHAVTFACIWSALAIYLGDSVIKMKSAEPARGS